MNPVGLGTRVGAGPGPASSFPLPVTSGGATYAINLLSASWNCCIRSRKPEACDGDKVSEEDLCISHWISRADGMESRATLLPGAAELPTAAPLGGELEPLHSAAGRKGAAFEESLERG